MHSGGKLRWYNTQKIPKLDLQGPDCLQNSSVNSVNPGNNCTDSDTKHLLRTHYITGLILVLL